MKKKAVVLMLAAMLTGAMFLTACGEKDKVSSKNNWEDDIDQADDDDEDDYDEDNGEDDAAVVDGEDVTDDTDEETADDEEENAIAGVRGTIEDGVFTNSVFKISFPVASDMYVFSDEEILQAIGAGADLMDANEILTAEQMEKATSGTLYDTMIYMSDKASNVIINYENLDLTAGMRLTEEQYVEILKAQLGQMQYPQYTFEEAEWTTLGGVDYLKLAATTNAGLSQYYFVRMVNNYAVGIIYTTKDGNEQMRDDFLNSFIEVE